MHWIFYYPLTLGRTRQQKQQTLAYSAGALVFDGHFSSLSYTQYISKPICDVTTSKVTVRYNLNCSGRVTKFRHPAHHWLVGGTEPNAIKGQGGYQKTALQQSRFEFVPSVAG